jgi:signal transduction histidine kinase
MGAGYPGFAIADMVDGKRVVAPVRELYRVIDYVEPMVGNEAVFGLDASSLSPHDDAMRRVDDTGLPAATGLSKLLKDTGADAQRGFAILMPVYRGGAAPNDAAARRQAVRGYTAAVLRAGDLFEKILATAGSYGNTGFDIRVYAAAFADDRQLAYGVSGAASGNQGPSWTAWLRSSPPEPLSHHFDIAGTAWHMVISAQPTLLITRHADALVALLLGCLATYVATAYLQMSTLRTQHIQQLVARRTAELTQRTEELTQRTEELYQVNDLLTDDINARTQVEEALRQSRSALRELAGHQESGREDERKRIARDIHDELGQNLLVLHLDVVRIGAHPDLLPAIKDSFEVVVEQIDRTVKAVRSIITDLRPGVLDLGLHAAVEWQAREFERSSGIVCELHVDHDEFALDDRRATALFRIVQESLTNVLRHAEASHVQIGMQRRDGRLFMEIADDGIGLSPDARSKLGGFGLDGIEERIHGLGGTLDIASTPGAGLTIMLPVPI